MALNRKQAVGLFAVIALIAGIAIGWFGKGMKDKNTIASVAGKDCTKPDGTKGKTDSTGACKG